MIQVSSIALTPRPMRKTTRLIGVGVGMLVLLVGCGQSSNQSMPQMEFVWGKRIWQQKWDDNCKIVVDEQLLWPNAPRVAIRYVWRLLRPTEANGTELYLRYGWESDNMGSSPAHPMMPIEVLDVQLAEGKMGTVFNQTGVCHACVAYPRAGGEMFPQHPYEGVFGPWEPPLPCEDSVAPALKDAKIELLPHDSAVLVGRDDRNQPVSFVLLSRHNGGETQYYWKPINAEPEPSTQAATRMSAPVTTNSKAQ